MAKKMINLDDVKKYVNACNELLASNLPQWAKKTLCTMAESLMMSVDAYNGYNNNYWLKQGCQEWHDAGEPEKFPEKYKFILGPEGAKNRSNDDFVSDVEGEYSRCYFSPKNKD